ncbi:MAG: hypothetical protein K6F09_06975 [Clostridiales bacterium]|nr:hypothetical protein [Clostridiales bacterium]
MKVKRIFAALTAAVMFVSFFAFSAFAEGEPAQKKNNYPLIFVHGLNGWGQGEGINDVMPYWGASTGDLMAYLRSENYDAESISVGPISSAWDRACEVYAQLTGTRVDYGVAHSAKYGHLRYGRTYDKAIVPDWGQLDNEGKIKKIHLIGHSFGGTAIRMLTELLTNGSAEEIAATSPDDISPLFTGGKGNWVQSVSTICTPHNSSSLYYILERLKLTKIVLNLSAAYVGSVGRSSVNGRYVDFHLEQFGLTNIPGQKNADNYFKAVRRFVKSGDCAQFDIYPQGAAAINEAIGINDEVYYFGYAFSTTETSKRLKTEIPIKSTNPLLKITAAYIGMLPSFTDKNVGITYDKSFRPNDGFVNTVSQMYPFDDPHTEFNASSIEPGIWNVMPVSQGDHGTAIGLLVKEDKVDEFHAFYDRMVDLLDSLD